MLGALIYLLLCYLVKVHGQQIEVDALSCHSPAPGINAALVETMINEAFDMAQTAVNFINTPLDTLDYKVHDIFQAMLGEPQNGAVASQAKGESAKSLNPEGSHSADNPTYVQSISTTSSASKPARLVSSSFAARTTSKDPTARGHHG